LRLGQCFSILYRIVRGESGSCRPPVSPPGCRFSILYRIVRGESRLLKS